MARYVRTGFFYFTVLPPIAVVFLHPWLRELYATDFHKPGIYRGERRWAIAWDLFPCKSSRVRNLLEYVSVDVLYCGGCGWVFTYGMHHFLRNNQGTWKRWLVEYATQEVHDHHRILDVVLTSPTRHDGVYPLTILGRCTRCTCRLSYGLTSTHSPDCPQSTCTTIAGSTARKAARLNVFRLGRIQLALFTESKLRPSLLVGLTRGNARLVHINS